MNDKFKNCSISTIIDKVNIYIYNRVACINRTKRTFIEGQKKFHYELVKNVKL